MRFTSSIVLVTGLAASANAVALPALFGDRAAHSSTVPSVMKPTGTHVPGAHGTGHPMPMGTGFPSGKHHGHHGVGATGSGGMPMMPFPTGTGSPFPIVSEGAKVHVKRQHEDFAAHASATTFVKATGTAGFPFPSGGAGSGGHGSAHHSGGLGGHGHHGGGSAQPTGGFGGQGQGFGGATPTSWFGGGGAQPTGGFGKIHNVVHYNRNDVAPVRRGWFW